LQLLGDIAKLLSQHRKLLFHVPFASASHFSALRRYSCGSRGIVYSRSNLPAGEQVYSKQLLQLYSVARIGVPTGHDQVLCGNAVFKPLWSHLATATSPVFKKLFN